MMITKIKRVRKSWVVDFRGYLLDCPEHDSALLQSKNAQPTHIKEKKDVK